MVFCDTSIIGAGDIYINRDGTSTSIVWCQLWPSDIMDTLVSDNNPGETIANYNLNISTLILHEATLMSVVPEVISLMPR